MYKAIVLSVLVIAAMPAHAETWKCYDLFDFSQRNVLLMASTVDDLSDAGEIEAAGIIQTAFYSVQGINRRWDFGLSKDGTGYRYAFTIAPDGTGFYYDFDLSNTSRDTYDCVKARS